jgi:hypothetical protein
MLLLLLLLLLLLFYFICILCLELLKSGRVRLCFEDLFRNKVMQLLHNFPLDRLTAAGVPFWSGAKKPPAPLAFDARDPLHAEFIYSAASLRAAMYGDVEVPPAMTSEAAAAFAATVHVEPFRYKLCCNLCTPHRVCNCF